MKKIVKLVAIIALFVIPGTISAQTDLGDVTAFEGLAPWGEEVSVMIDNKILELYNVQVVPDMNSIGTRIYVSFATKKKYKSLEEMQADGCTEFFDKHVTSSIMDTTFGVWKTPVKTAYPKKGEHAQVFVPGEAITLPDGSWRVVMKGVFAIPNAEIKLLTIKLK